MNDFQYSDAGLTLSKDFEGLRLSVYEDCAAHLTIGYGHTGPDVHWGMRITEAQAETLLRSDVAAAVTCVNHAVTVPLNQNQFDALVDFTFNAGRASFLRSTLLRELNAGRFAMAAGCFGMWVDAGGKPLPDLVRRRAAEKELFLKPL